MKPAIFTKELPTKEGYYWWTDFGEHTPCIVEVTKHGDGFEAHNEEYDFVVCKQKIDKNSKNADGYYFGEELWSYIEVPILPNGKVIKPNCY